MKCRTVRIVVRTLAIYPGDYYTEIAICSPVIARRRDRVSKSVSAAMVVGALLPLTVTIHSPVADGGRCQSPRTGSYYLRHQNRAKPRGLVGLPPSRTASCSGLSAGQTDQTSTGPGCDFFVPSPDPGSARRTYEEYLWQRLRRSIYDTL